MYKWKEVMVEDKYTLYYEAWNFKCCLEISWVPKGPRDLTISYPVHTRLIPHTRGKGPYQNGSPVMVTSRTSPSPRPDKFSCFSNKPIKSHPTGTRRHPYGLASRKSAHHCPCWFTITLSATHCGHALSSSSQALNIGD